MASHEAYLRNALSLYRNADLAKRDIISCIQQYTDLRPLRDRFVFNDGNTKELLCLDGTLPVCYKGSIYNIPVCMWLVDTHPHNPPMVYIKPTMTMQIKPGKHVDTNGKVYLPYLHDWKYPQSDLLGLTQILAIVFGDDMPVFSKGAVPRPAASNATPPYPSAGANMPVPNYPGTAPGYQPPNQPYPPTTGYPPGPYSGYPSQQAQAQPQPATAQRPPYPPAAGGYQPPTTNFSYPQQNAFNPGTSAATRTGTLPLSEDQIKASLLSAVEDKMRRRLRDIFSQAQAEMDSLKRTQDDLQKGKRNLEEMMQKLEKEQNDVERNTTLLQEKNSEMAVALSRMSNKEEMNIDEAVLPTTPLYKQIVTSFAEEQATEDGIYYLGEALRKGVIDIDIFLKQVRDLSRKQFMLRALINRCREKAGLPDISG